MKFVCLYGMLAIAAPSAVSTPASASSSSSSSVLPARATAQAGKTAAVRPLAAASSPTNVAQESAPVARSPATVGPAAGVDEARQGTAPPGLPATAATPRTAAGTSLPGRAAAGGAPQTNPQDWLAQAETQGTQPQQAARWPLIVAVLLMLAAAAAFVALRFRGGHAPWAGGSGRGETIEILAVRPLGHKHRLVLVQAGGERLLLAATDREVRLLSHLGLGAFEEASLPKSGSTRQAAVSTGSMAHHLSHPAVFAGAVAAPAPTAPLGQPTPAAAVSPHPTYATVAAATMPLGQAVPPAPGGSLSAEALYEGAARSMDLDDQEDDTDDSAAPMPSRDDTLASDVAGLARWRQAAAQGADPWGKQL